MKTFEELAAPWAWNGAFPQHASWGWFDGACPKQVRHQCIKPEISAPVPEVPEPASALLLAFGLIVVYLWNRHA